MDRKAGRKLKLSTLLNLSWLLLYLLTSALVVILAYGHMRAKALQDSRNLANLLLEKNLAIHAYYSHVLRPQVGKLLPEGGREVYFDPSWMSSTYAVRHMDRLFKELAGEDYYYKECAINARSPENEADDFERRFIAGLNADPALREHTGIRLIDGLPYFVVLKRGEIIEEGCLTCHSDPARAPAGLVDIYGPERSFHRQLGEVVSAVSIRIPLAVPFQAANRMATELSVFLLAVLVGVFALQHSISNKLLLSPLALIGRKARQLSREPDSLGEQIPPPRGRELAELAEAFNLMSAELRRNRDHLEQQVESRSGQLERMRRQNEMILLTAREGIFGLDRQGLATFVNPAALQMVGWSEGELLGRLHHELIHHSRPDGSPYPTEECPVHSVLRTGEIIHLQEETFWHKDGTPFPIEFSCAPIREKGRITGAVITFRDITERKAEKEKIQQLAYYDTLTGLPNRILFQDRLEHALAQCRRDGDGLALMFLDLDDFKHINDTQGHAVGDRFLRDVAARLRETVRQADTLARLGGDEFVWFGHIQEQKDVTAVAGKILQALPRPVEIDGITLACSVSIGIALFPRDAEDGGELLRCADTAMYQAKRKGKNTFHIGA